MPVKGLFKVRKASGYEPDLFCYPPESWTQMWTDIFGGKDKDGNNRIKVDTELVSAARKGFPDYEKEDACYMKWSVTRL